MRVCGVWLTSGPTHVSMAIKVPLLNVAPKDLPKVGAACAPLLLTSYGAEPALALVGTALSLWLTRITVDTPGCPVPEADEAKTLEKSMKSLIITSTGNRVTRALLGTVHMLAAIAHGMSIHSTIVIRPLPFDHCHSTIAIRPFT